MVTENNNSRTLFSAFNKKLSIWFFFFLEFQCLKLLRMAEALQSRSLSSTAIIYFFLAFSFSLRCEGRKPEISSPEAGKKGVTAVSQHGILSTLFFPMAGFEVNFVGGRRWVSAGGWPYCWYWNSPQSRMRWIFCRGLYSLGMRFCLCTYIRVLFWVYPLKMVPLLGCAGDTSLHRAGASEPPLKILPLFPVLWIGALISSPMQFPSKFAYRFIQLLQVPAICRETTKSFVWVALGPVIRSSAFPPVANDAWRAQPYNVNMLSTLLRPTEQMLREHVADRLACQGLFLLFFAMWVHGSV